MSKSKDAKIRSLKRQLRRWQSLASEAIDLSDMLQDDREKLRTKIWHLEAELESKDRLWFRQIEMGRPN